MTKFHTESFGDEDARMQMALSTIAKLCDEIDNLHKRRFVAEAAVEGFSHSDRSYWLNCCAHEIYQVLSCLSKAAAFSPLQVER